MVLYVHLLIFLISSSFFITMAVLAYNNATLSFKDKKIGSTVFQSFACLWMILMFVYVLWTMQQVVQL